ncbi:suppressor of tumorigenicity 7 protein-like isoform X1 [Vidua chalybeata]|uniref:suppressor of tumorigenicity 7 protein-like isoform X1 n=2 Tax=Vidua chalybeata TaxID=81927 RepID=UPI0023A8C33F|nr:suppressor of tumorigenicity 7 protein-like isoform X1 [Vidua chalybeata]
MGSTNRLSTGTPPCSSRRCPGVPRGLRRPGAIDRKRGRRHLSCGQTPCCHHHRNGQDFRYREHGAGRPAAPRSLRGPRLWCGGRSVRVSPWSSSDGLVTMFLSTLTPKFYFALTVTSSFISGLIFVFEWWHFRKYGTSFIEQVSVSHLRPLIGGAESSPPAPAAFSAGENETSRQNMPECKVWRNPLNLFRGAEYSRYMWVTGKEPLTYYDMNLSAQDHQTFFTCDTDALRPSDTVMQKAWRERNPQARIKAAYQALELNNDCATAYVLLAEEEATTIVDAEKYFKQALKAGEMIYRKSQNCHSQSPQHEAQLRRDTNVLVYVKRRLAMCARKLGRIREAVKMMRDLMKEFPLLSMLNIHENLLEALLELQAYADVQAVLAKYDDISLPKSAAICYTAALLKARAVSERFSPETASKRGLSTAEINAVEAIHRAVEFNPHVPKYLLEMKSLVLPPEHILKRGDSEAVAYAFFHLQHWKRIEGALNLLHCTWEGTFRMIPYPLEKGHLFYPYPSCTETADRELLPTFHEVSVYPQKELPFFIHFTAGLCSFSAMLALLTHQFPELMVIFAKARAAFQHQRNFSTEHCGEYGFYPCGSARLQWG